MIKPPGKEEPMTSVILKCLAIICVLAAIYYFFKMMLLGARADFASPLAASIALGQAFGAAVAAVSFWWMASILTLLNRIANNQEKAISQTTPRIPTAMERSASSKPATRAADDPTAKYEL